MRSRSTGMTWALKALIVVYLLALAAMPFGHHDLACHLKSSTHCATCNVGTSADPGGDAPAIAPVFFVDAGRADEGASFLLTSPALLSSAGRSPPAL